MSTRTMSPRHQSADASPWLWPLPAGSMQRLEATPHERWLEVQEGEVWATGGLGGVGASDHWLRAGQRLVLPAGTAWLLQGWQASRLVLLQPPPAPSAPGWFSAFLQRAVQLLGRRSGSRWAMTSPGLR